MESETEKSTKQSTALRFDGNASDLYGIYLTNIALTMITLGIYSFWARVKVKQYLYQHTEFAGHRFSYLATGPERFKGFLKAIAIIGVLVAFVTLVYFLIHYLLPRSGYTEARTASIANGVSDILSTFFIMVLAPLVVVGRRRYQLGRSSWRNISFSFNGKAVELAGIYFKGTLISALSLGFLYPWFQCKLRSFNVNNSLFGNEKFSFHGLPGNLLAVHLKGILISVLTLGVYVSWWRAERHNFMWGNVRFQGHFLEANMTGWEYLRVNVIALLITVGTLGLAIPFAIVMRQKLLLESISFPEELNLERIQGSKDRLVNAVFDGLADAGDAVDSIGDIF